MTTDEFDAMLEAELKGPATCDAGRLLRELVMACADANTQEADDSDDGAGGREVAQRYDMESDGKVKLFLAATRVTNGSRWKHRGNDE